MISLMMITRRTIVIIFDYMIILKHDCQRKIYSVMIKFIITQVEQYGPYDR